MRLGGVAKGNLRTAGGERLVERLVRTCGTALPEARQVLVGAADAYSDLNLPGLVDSPAGIGPLGGLRALLLHARSLGGDAVLALACDLPYLGVPLVRRLAREAPGAALLAPREGGLWQTLVARYSLAALPAVDAAIAAGDYALQRVASRLGDTAVPLVLGAEERDELRDWDSPEDLA